MRRWGKKCTLCRLLRSEQGVPSTQCQYHDLIKSALTQFIKENRHLSVCDVNERSQTHKLAEYIQQTLPDYNIDCEYNKNLTKDKELDFTKIVHSIKTFLNERGRDISNQKLNNVIEQLRQELDASLPIFDESDLNQPSFLQFSNCGASDKKYIKRVYPDIIAHLRGTNTNKIVIEAKKKSNKDPKARFFDLIKLGLFTEHKGQFGYEVGYFIELPSKKIPDKFEIKFTPYNLVPNSNVFIVEIKKI